MDPQLEKARLENRRQEAGENADLWQRLDELAQAHEIEWVWIKGHAGHVGNEHADALANRGVESVRT